MNLPASHKGGRQGNSRPTINSRVPDSARHHSRVTLSLAAIYSDMWSTYETRVEFSAWRITTRAFGNTILFFSCHSGRSSLFFFCPRCFARTGVPIPYVCLPQKPRIIYILNLPSDHLGASPRAHLSCRRFPT